MKKMLLASIVVVVVVVVVGLAWAWRHPLAIFNALNRRALKNAGFQRVQVQSPAGAQVLWEAGSGPALIFLHGAGDQAASWAKVAPEFKSRYHVLVLDMAGHGESEPRSGPISISAVLSGLESVVEQRTDGQPVAIVGNSLGAWMAMLYAKGHSRRVERLVLVNGGAIMGHRPDLAFMPKNREQARRLFDSIMDPGSLKPAGFVLDDVVRQANSGPIARLLLAVNDWPAYLMDNKLAEFTTPVDLVWGTADQIFSLDYAERMKSQLSAVRMTAIERCGHIPQQECPLTFTAKLNDVLAQAPPVAAPALVPASAKP